MNSNKLTPLLFGSAGSVLILIILFTIRLTCPALLDIDVKWLVIAAVPLLLALVAGKFIKSFKGLGIELELQVNSPLIENSSVIEHVRAVSSTDKLGLEYLRSMSDSTKRTTNVLRFLFDRRNYYDLDIVIQYLDHLPNIEFIEVVGEDQRLIYFIDLREYRQSRSPEIKTIYIREVIQLVERRPSEYPGFLSSKIILERVNYSRPLLQVLRAIKAVNRDILPVVGQRGQLIGLVSKDKLNEAVANQVLKTLNEEKNA